MTDYFAWVSQPPRAGCLVGHLRNFDGVIDMQRGRLGAIADSFPDDAELPMDPQRPKDVKLYDQLLGIQSLIVTSPKLTLFLKGLNLPGVEYLPVKIIDHKGKVASPDYAIVHPCNVYDCIDKTATKLFWNTIDPELISGVLGIVLDHSKIDPAVPVFRCKHMAEVILVRQDIADQILAQDFVGPIMTPSNEYGL
jgi:hypothetical protein